MIFCTIASLSHLYRAKVLAVSLKIHYPDARFVFVLVEKTNELDEHSQLCFDEVVLAQDIGVDQFTTWMFRYDVNEASCALKGELLAYVLQRFPEEQHIVYLDSDMKLYSRLIEVEQALAQHAIVLTPHSMGKPTASSDMFGIYNTGFLAIRRSPEAMQFVDWWRGKLRYGCYVDKANKVFLDQAWLNEIPSYIPTYSLNHPGYNVAFWNLYEKERRMKVAPDGSLLVGELPLRCFHFSQLNKSLAEYVHRFRYQGTAILKSLYHEYVIECELTGVKSFSDRAWSYDCYHDGSKIEKIARMHFRQNPSIAQSCEDPFVGYGRDLDKSQVILPVEPKVIAEHKRKKRTLKMLQKSRRGIRRRKKAGSHVIPKKRSTTPKKISWCVLKRKGCRIWLIPQKKMRSRKKVKLAVA
jgi:hypothetical protein